MRTLLPVLLALALTASPGVTPLRAANPPRTPTGAGGADAGDNYLRYAHPTIREPFTDLLNLTVPPELKGQPLAELGYVDVTQAPFHADPTGQEDSTRAIQAAVLFARDHQMACFFPAGTYVLSDTLSCIQQLYRRANGRVFGGNRFPNLLVGSRAKSQRPRLVLAPRAAGFSDPAKPRIFVHFWSRGYRNPTTADRVSDGLSPEVEQPNIGMNQMLVNLDVAIGEGNPGAIAVRHQAAEGSAIEDCTIDATHGLTGLQGGIGSGGSSAGVAVLGGRVGLDFTGYLSGTQPTPVITGFTLIGQTEAAIRSTSRQTLVAVGLKIVADRCAGPLIQVGQGLAANHGELTMVDSEIEFRGATLDKAERVVVASDLGAQSLHWRSGGRSIFRGVEIHGRTEVAPAPVIISGHGGGNWYNFRDRSARLLVDRAKGPLRFYQFSVQQVTSELRGTSHVSFFGTKYEGNNPMLTVSDSDHVRLFGHGGNAKGRPDASLFVFERTTNFLLANGVDGPTKIGSKSLSHWEGSTDPRQWHFLIDHPANGAEWKLPPLERPVLYQRGSPWSKTSSGVCGRAKQLPVQSAQLHQAGANPRGIFANSRTSGNGSGFVKQVSRHLAHGGFSKADRKGIAKVDINPWCRNLKPDMTAKTFTLRLPPDAYERAAGLAERRGQSLNRLFQDALVLLDAQEREKQLFDDFSAIAEAGSQETDVEFALDAQAQAATNS